MKAMPRCSDIAFPGFVSGAGKTRFFNDTRFMVFPSVSAGDDVEGLPVALLEALCCGKIVIASRDTNLEMLPEFEQIKRDVLFLPNPRDTEAFSNAIRQILKIRPKEIKARPQKLRTIMSRYLWDNLIKEYLTALDLSRLSHPKS